MCDLINEIIAVGGTTAHQRAFDEDRVVAEFILSQFVISCLVAEEKGAIVGFQCLEWCDPEWPGDNKLPADWAVIATYVRRSDQGRGVGQDLFRKSRTMAEKAGVVFIDATIRNENSGGLAFYAKLGFESYRMGDETTSKRLSIITTRQ